MYSLITFSYKTVAATSSTLGAYMLMAGYGRHEVQMDWKKKVFNQIKGLIGRSWHASSIQWNLTSPLGQLHSRDTSIQGIQNLVPENVHHDNLCTVTFIEGTTLFQGKGTLFQVPKPRFNLNFGDTLTLKKWLATKIVDKFKCLLESRWRHLSKHELSRPQA